MMAIRRRLARAVAEFLAARRDLGDFSGKTHQAYACDLRQLTNHLGSAAHLERISAADIQGWVGQLRSSGYATASCRRKVAVARCFFNHCVRQDLLPSSPFARLRFRFRAQPELPRTLRHEEMAAILAYVREAAGRSDLTARQRLLAQRNQAIHYLLLTTGLRVGELVSLRTSDMDLLERAIRVRGKGGRERIAVIESDPCIASLRAYLNVREALCPASDRAFLNARGAPISTQGVAHMIKCVAEGAGVERSVTPHMFRHTAATLLLSAGVDIRLVQVYLGHQSITTTQRYTHVSRALLRRSLARADPLGQFSEVA